MNHELKTWPPYYQAIIDGKKRFEIRKMIDVSPLVMFFACVNTILPKN